MLEKKVQMLSLNEFSVKKGFWENYMDIVRTRMIPYQWEALNDRVPDAEPSYCMSNFKKAAGLLDGPFQGRVFQDSDTYKWLEAVAYSLMWHPDPELEEIADGAIDIISKAQQEDGYLDTYYILTGLDKRFTNVMDNHELYCLGHMVEAAVAYYNATGKRKFLDTAIRYVDCVNEHFGPEPGKLKGYPGHEDAELALIKLYAVTKDEKHLKLAEYFINQRGQEPHFFREEREKYHNPYKWEESYFQDKYYQADMPVRDQQKAEGHAVRAVYLYTGMAEVASVTEDRELFSVCERLWKNIVERQMYITGSIGSSEYGEAFTFDYDLPNDTLYAETCATIGLIFFARRMFEITKDSRYTDIMEQCLYNGVISGMALDGTKFFYVNPLEMQPEASKKDFYKRHVDVERQKWFVCACCPPNIARLLSSLAGYAYEKNDRELYVNLFVGGDIKTELNSQGQILHIETEYPNEGTVSVTVENASPTEFSIALRIPGWCRSWSISVNGERLDVSPEKGYVSICRIWRSGDRVELSMKLEPRLMAAHPRVRDDIGKVALMRGPLVYCLEEEDNGDQLQEIYFDENAVIEERYEKELLNGVTVLYADGYRLTESDWDGSTLYRTYTGRKFESQKLKFIPYYSWANRSVGELLVWVRLK